MEEKGILEKKKSWANSKERGQQGFMDTFAVYFFF
jgi:hypothetical protein